jgi:hypothetical protein
MTQPEPLITQPPTEGEEKLTTIYALVDPRDGKPFYVGKADDEIDRCRKHTTAARLWRKWVEAGSDQTRRPWTTNNAEKCARIMEILDAGMKVQVRVLERCPVWIEGKEAWREREAWWEQEMIRLGFKLTNSAQCGAGGGSASEDTKRAISNGLKSSESLRRHNESRRGIPLPQWHIDKAREAMMTSEKWRQARAAKRGIKKSPEEVKKLRAAMLASPRHKASREALKGVKQPRNAALHRGVKESPETCAAISAGIKASAKFQTAMSLRKGVPHSPEHREALRISNEALWDRIRALRAEGMPLREARKAAKGPKKRY